MRLDRRTACSSSLAAIVLSLVVAAQAVAGSWSPPVRVGDGDELGGFVTLGGGAAVLTWMQNDRVFAKRTTDQGATWRDRVQLGRGDMPDVSAHGSTVDVVWRGWSHGEVHYTRSLDGGASFAPSVVLFDGSAWLPHVARGPRGLVALGWGRDNADGFFARVSTDGGLTFGHRTYWPTALIDVAVGEGVVYVLYYGRDDRPRVTRSLDGGRTWSQAVVMSSRPQPMESPAISADGSDAYYAYTGVDANEHSSIRYRRTTDKGAMWSNPGTLSPASVSAWEPLICVHDGAGHAMFKTTTALYYTRTRDGSTWIAPEAVTRRDSVLHWYDSSKLGCTGKPMVVYGTFQHTVFYARMRVTD